MRRAGTTSPSGDGFFWRDKVGPKYVPGPEFNSPLPGVYKDPGIGIYRHRAIPLDPSAERSRLRRILNDMLDNPGRYRSNARSVSNRFRSALRASNANVIDTAAKINGGLRLGGLRIPGLAVRIGRKLHL